MIINQVLTVVRTEGAAGLLARAGSRILKPRAKSFRALRERFVGKRALEIGGPSAPFQARGIFPAYPILATVDNCNFASRTIWEGEIDAGASFRFDPSRPAGRQYIAEATALPAIAGGSYDVVLSSHTIEHTANPLKALQEWRRVLKDDGLLVLIVPHKDGTFDHRRPVTRLGHLVEDFERNTDEDDTTHVPEILRLHDLRRDPGGTTAEAFAQRSAANLAIRALHHHVFDTALVEAMVRQAGFRPLGVEARRPYHILLVAEKAGEAETSTEPMRFASPFRSDGQHA